MCVLALLALMTGCAPMRKPPVAPVPKQPAPTKPPAPIPETQPPADPRHKASLQLSNQGRLLLQQERIDDAIRTLEQAISLYPQNGESYYYMAEAWLIKGSFRQAGEFNRLAGMYLDNPDWSSRVNKQRRAIGSGNPSP
jgi:tetratricopeptide (TPR) repeat protein